MGEPERGMESEVATFVYPACSGALPEHAWNGWLSADEVDGRDRASSAAGKERMGRATDLAGAGSQSEANLRAYETGRTSGREEGRAAERDAQMAARRQEEQQIKQQLKKLVADFAAERDRFFQTVEPEVVKLALAVAARILRREAQMDPLLLTGAVRVALGQLAGTTEVRLTVPAAQMELWQEAIALIPNLAVKPAVIAGDGMRLGDCVIESKVGTVDLGVRSQLGEIERGFFDRTNVAGEVAKSTLQAAPEEVAE